jgi:hypothetical protein
MENPASITLKYFGVYQHKETKRIYKIFRYSNRHQGEFNEAFPYDWCGKTIHDPNFDDFITLIKVS